MKKRESDLMIVTRILIQKDCRGIDCTGNSYNCPLMYDKGSSFNQCAIDRQLSDSRIPFFRAKKWIAENGITEADLLPYLF